MLTYRHFDLLDRRNDWRLVYERMQRSDVDITRVAGYRGYIEEQSDEEELSDGELSDGEQWEYE